MAKISYGAGFPRIGEHRELKKALEQFWADKISADQLREVASTQRKKHWRIQKEKGIEYISSNDFSYYDNMLDTAVMLQAIPARFADIENDLARYFSMARGTQEIPAMEMTKWFNTNYHYIVPELNDGIEFKLNADKNVSEYLEAKERGIKTKIDLIGPVTFCALSKTSEKGKSVFAYFDAVLSVYQELFAKIARLDDEITVQIEEPFFVKDPSQEALTYLRKAVTELCEVSPALRVVVATYFEQATEAVKLLASTPVWGIGLDFVYGPKNLDVLGELNGKKLIAGVIDGRNVWKTDIASRVELLESMAKKVGRENILVSSSCSLLHVPFSTANEPESNVKDLLSFACEKLEEISVTAKLFHGKALSDNEEKCLEQCTRANRIISEKKGATGNLLAKARKEAFAERNALQRKRLCLPLLPTTTIGSFPQTPELRKWRFQYRKSEITREAYEAKIEQYIDDCIAAQDNIGLDVLVHGEPERNDMVEYFGERLEGFHFTVNGWVQSYGSRCVKPPIIYDAVSRPEPMTVKWIVYAQGRTKKPVKGMLTGPTTIINWSFVRKDIPWSDIAMQIAEGLNKEIRDLQEAGIQIIQVDEPAFKEGYPLRKENIPSYEKWAVTTFKHAVSSAAPETQIHTHMCYSQFNDIIQTLEEMDADVITVETARSGNKLLKIFQTTHYKNEIGPGVYDIHSPRVPSTEEFAAQIKARLEVVDKQRMWVNPDCGLKTRNWKEVIPALSNMIAATRAVRETL